MDKTALRLYLRQIRREIQKKPGLSEQIISRLKSLSEFKKARNLLVYWGNDNDVYTLSLIKYLQEKRRTVYLPYVRNLAVGRVDSIANLQVDKFGICVPGSKATKEELNSIDLVIIPGLGFDRLGGRIGHGYGWYDKFLPKLNKNISRIGLSFSALLVGKIPTENHDQLVDFVVTEKETIITNARKKPSIRVQD